MRLGGAPVRRLALGLTLVLALGVAACSGDDGDGEDDEPTASGSTVTDGPTDDGDGPTDDGDDQTDDPTDDPTEHDGDDGNDGDDAALLLAAVVRQLPAPNGPSCRSRPAAQLYCSVDGAARFRLAAGQRVQVEDARAEAEPRAGAWTVIVQLDDPGALTFARITRRLVGSNTQLAVVVGTEVVTAPTVAQPITDGLVAISGDFGRGQARRIAELLD